MSKADRPTPFMIEGQFLSFITDGGKVKHMRVAVADHEVFIKLSKEARASLLHLDPENPFHGLRPWDGILISGEQTIDPKTGDVELKAYRIQRGGTGEGTRLDSPGVESKSASSCRKVKLLSCHKSGCQKRGSQKQCRAIEAILRDRGLSTHVELEKTGCLGKCSQAPNMVLMPGKKRVSGMHPEAIAELIERISGVARG